jgi:hypothetical protein
VGRHHRRLGSKRSIAQIRPTKADYVAAFREGATWVEIAIGLAAGVIVSLIAYLLGAGFAGWIGAMSVGIGGPIGPAAQRAARKRDLRSRSTPGAGPS